MSSLEQLPEPDNDRKVEFGIEHKNFKANSKWPQWSATVTVVLSVAVIVIGAIAYSQLV
jgi:hypothetical protein